MALSGVSSFFTAASAKADLSDNEASTRSTVSSWATSPSMYRPARKGCSGASEASTDNDFLDCSSSEEDSNPINSPSHCTSPSFSGSESDSSDTESISEPLGQQVDKLVSRKTLEAAAIAATYPVAILLQIRLAMGACSFPQDLAVYGTRPRNEDNATENISRAAEQRRKSVDEFDSLKATKTTMHSSSGTSGVSWAAMQQQRLRERKVARTNASSLPLSNEDFARKVRSILNKLTVERFDTLYEQLANSGASTPWHIAILVREIFEIATSQHNFISMYASLCQRLESDPRIVNATSAMTDAKAVSFRRILLDQCQTSFEEMLAGSHEGIEGQGPEEAEELRIRCKQRALGNIKLTARLLVLDMLSSKLLITLCETLIENSSTRPDALECLAALLTVAGPEFDTDTWLSHSAFEAIFEQVKALTGSKVIPARMRFLLRDVLELRAAGWVDKKAVTAQSKGPMKLSDVRGEAAGSRGEPPGAGRAWQPSGNVPAGFRPSLVRQPMQKPPVPEPKVVVLPSLSTSKPTEPTQYSKAVFHRELWRILCDLTTDGDARRAAKRIEEQNVPASEQASEFMDLITRAAEEENQTQRHKFFALAACLAEGTAFKRSECLEGVENFFLDVFDDLCEEVQNLAGIVTRELIPALLHAVQRSELVAVVPPDMRP